MKLLNIFLFLFLISLVSATFNYTYWTDYNNSKVWFNATSNTSFYVYYNSTLNQSNASAVFQYFLNQYSNTSWTFAEISGGAGHLNVTFDIVENAWRFDSKGTLGVEDIGYYTGANHYASIIEADKKFITGTEASGLISKVDSASPACNYEQYEASSGGSDRLLRRYFCGAAVVLDTLSSPAIPSNTYIPLLFRNNGTVYNASKGQNGIWQVNGSDTTYANSDYVGVDYSISAGLPNVWFKNFRIRKYVQTDPVITCANAEYNNFTYQGVTYGARKYCNITGIVNTTGQELNFPYNIANSDNLTIMDIRVIPEGITPILPLNNTNITLSSLLNFTYDVGSNKNITTRVLINNVTYFTDIVDNTNITINHSVRFTQSGTYYIQFVTNDTNGLNESGVYNVYVYDIVNLISPGNNLFTPAADIPFTYGVFTGSANSLVQLRINGNLMQQNFISSIQNVTSTQPLVNGIYYWNVTLLNYVLNTTYITPTYTLTIGSVAGIFNTYLGVNISSCSNAVMNTLNNCTDGYMLTRLYNFSAVVCYPFSTGLDYSCFANASSNIGYYSKNNYTIFYEPNNTWTYADTPNNAQLVQHTGAIFYYGGNAIDTGFEIISPNQFVFLPAQNRTYDCGVRYSLTCSYFNGFVVNNRQVVISDRDNYWFSAGGLGIQDYNETLHGNITVPFVVYPLDYNNIGNNTVGIFKRIACNTNGTLFNIQLLNTQPQQYSIIVGGTNSSNYSVYSPYVSASYTLYNDSSILVYADGIKVCQYNNGTSLFYGGADLSFIMGDLTIHIVNLVGLFVLVLSVINPFFVMGLVILNDAFRIWELKEIALLCTMSIIGGLAINIQTYDRAIKHLIIITALFTGYVIALTSTVNITLTGVDFTAVTNIFDHFARLDPSDIGQFAANSILLIIDLFLFVITLPAIFIGFLFSLLHVISPALYDASFYFKTVLIVGLSAYVYLKAYEVIRNTFRGI